jgi:hypothetical protein
MNLYEAFKSNPLRFMDPTGMYNWEAYFRDRAKYGWVAAAWWDWIGEYNVTPNGDDFDDLVKQLQARQQKVHQLGLGLQSGLEVIGVFSDGADFAIVIDELGRGEVSWAQLAVFVPVIGRQHFKVFNKCGKLLKRIDADMARFLGSIKKAGELRAIRRGVNNAGDLEIHHLIEVRFHGTLGIRNSDDVEAVLIPALEHRGVRPRDLAQAIDEQLRRQNITQMLRNEIPYRPRGAKNYYEQFTAQEIYDAHKRVYTDFGMPDLMDAIKRWFEPFGVDFSKPLD